MGDGGGLEGSAGGGTLGVATVIASFFGVSGGTLSASPPGFLSQKIAPPPSSRAKKTAVMVPTGFDFDLGGGGALVAARTGGRKDDTEGVGMLTVVVSRVLMSRAF